GELPARCARRRPPLRGARRPSWANDARLGRDRLERRRRPADRAVPLHPARPLSIVSVDVSQSLLTPLAFLERTALVFPGRIAVVDGDHRFTWADVRERVRRLAVSLQAGGIERGDRVAFLAPNVHELLEAHFGVPAAGAVLVAINTRLMPEEVAYILDHSGARILVVHESLRPLVED